MELVYIDKDHAILKKLWKRCENEDLCDVVLIVGPEEKRIPAHRCILMEASDYFNALFTSSVNKNSSKYVQLSKVDGEALKSIIEYFYLGKLTITEGNILDVLVIADLLCLRNIVAACGNFLAEHLNGSNCFKLVKLATRFNCTELLEQAIEYCLEHFMDISKTDVFLNLDVNHLGEILKCDDLCVSSEEDVFNSIMRWISHDQIEREKYKIDLLTLVRMTQLRLRFLKDKLKPICDAEKSLNMYVKALEWHMLPHDGVPNRRRIYQILMAFAVNEPNNDSLLIHYYCPQKLEWIILKSVCQLRYGFGIAVSKNCLFIVGGRDTEDNVLSSVISLNLKKMQIRNINPMIKQREHCGTAVLNGFLYVVGGWNDMPLNSVEKWNPQTNEWTLLAPMSVNRYSVSTAVLNEKLYAVGGHSRAKELNVAECYDPIYNVWKSISSTNCRSPTVAVVNDRLYAVSRGIVELYDSSINKWIILPQTDKISYEYNACISFRNCLLSWNNYHTYQYNFLTNKWNTIRTITDLNKQRGIFAYSGKLPKTKFIRT